MKTKEVTVNKGLTFNLGKFQSARADYSILVELEEGDKPEDAIKYAEDLADDSLVGLSHELEQLKGLDLLDQLTQGAD